MPGIPDKNHRRVVAAFQKIGYWIERESRHIIMTNGAVQLRIPRHNPINALTMASIVRDAGLTRQQFDAIY